MNISTRPYENDLYGHASYSSRGSTPPYSQNQSTPYQNIPLTTGDVRNIPASPQPLPRDELNQISTISPATNPAYVVTVQGRERYSIPATPYGFERSSIPATPYGFTQSSIPARPYDTNTHQIPGKEEISQDSTAPGGIGQIDGAGRVNAAEDSVSKAYNNPAEGLLNGLTEQDIRLLTELQKTDTEVRAHEMAHIAAGGQYVTSVAKLELRKGPDGRNYAVGGEVSIDTSPIPGDPRATAEKMRQIQMAALAPASPSNQDRKVAARAAALGAKAMSELMLQQTKERTSDNEFQAFGNRQAADSYSRINGMPLESQKFKTSIYA
ncbi:MAG: hypothetical protein HQK66_11565 [Desulfamplus sp.]|nr:hypothetical protein [Desulfamplus sp.]